MQTGAHLLLCLILHYVEAAEASQCWQGATYSEAVVSPALRSSNILRVPDVSSLAQCAGACCDLPGCNLAWLFERRCYILSCQQRENCQPRQRPGADSYMAFLQRGPPQTLLLQSLVRGEPYPSRWRPHPSGDVEALKDLALLDGPQTDFGDPGGMDLEYPESELGPEDNGGDLPDWPAALEGRDGFNLSESEGRLEGLGFATEGAESSLPSPSTGATVNQGAPPGDPTPGDTPENKKDSELQNTSMASSGPTFTPKPQNDSVHSSQPSQIRTFHPNKAPSHLSSTVPLTTSTQTELTLPRDTVELVASVGPEPQTAARRNQTPKAVTLPVTQVVSLPASSTIIKGSQSSDDGVIISHHWEQVGGPSIELGAFSDTQIPNLSKLAPGEYTFRLTITDSAGLSDSTTATVKVIQPVENDRLPYPSHDTLTPTSSPGLAATLAHRQGDPTTATSFVTTAATQMTENKNTPIAEVKESNGAPVAVVGPNRQLTLPVTSVTLDGSSSTDDHAVTSYHWDTIRGPPGSRTEGVDKPVAIVTGLRAGRYTFSLTVSDQEGLKDSAFLTVRVQEARSLPPVAHASGSHTLTLPNNSLVLRGSVTDGDPAEMHFLWFRDSQSPAAGDVLYGSEQQAFLYLANLVEGTYLFQLHVTDTQGRSSTATATVEVRPDPGGREEVEVEMLVALAQVSVSQKDTVLRQLAALLHVLDNDIHLRCLWGHSDLSTVLRFSVQGPEGPVPGPKLASVLHGQLLREKTDYLLFRVLRVDTVSVHPTPHTVCLLRCSGHGTCDPITKECVCDPFWTENLIRRFFGDGESNCEWRVLYFILSFFMVIVFIVTVTWACVYCCKRRSRTKVRKKTKYTILDNMDEQEKMELRPKYNIKHRSTEHNSSLMMSESELDSDQDTIFSRDRPVRSRNRTNAQAARNGNTFG
ncbi:dyslexia-associated protein KIAA0319 homolog isoform X1 [Oncorhynchus mykiss]|uniref:dyslexia-associated protein KIAA0319 homolog isoform X1 n=1 Tax=Oncorhynchus mykiss TaxID=8022 RepID=UPI001877E57A|nr:dyslexia-associated protein KIAA0319 homolog isoform X1 [Oncorhynchus mykiss]XP_021449160.2 dyslexia-associated protein KIAA0319 homolog isoform X1 [Oncorhynchus mykiss]